jgi:uncharacterized protein YndB with AHSA1/START domain
MRIFMIVSACVIGLMVIVLIVGWSLPVAHRASRSVALHASPETVFNLISRPADFPSWRSDVRSVDILPSEAGHSLFRENGKGGLILFRVESVVPNRQLITRIADKSLPFGGTWTYDIEPNGATTTLRITEDGEVYNPLFRFVSRFVIGHGATVDRYLGDVRRHLETP